MTSLPEHGSSNGSSNSSSDRKPTQDQNRSDVTLKLHTEDTSPRRGFRVAVESNGAERREHRRYEMDGQTLSVARWDANRRSTGELGYIMDLSAGGVRVRTNKPVKADTQIRVRLEMPSYAGICPFVDTTHTQPRPKNEWVGWLAVSRVLKSEGNEYDVAGRLVDMDEMDRGMLGLYLSTQPIAA